MLLSCSRRSFWIFLFSFIPLCTSGQTRGITGIVIDAHTHQPISSAQVRLLETRQSTLTDSTGRFVFTEHSGPAYTIAVHHIAYADAEQRVSIAPDEHSDILISLHPSIFRTDEVVVQSARTISAMRDHPLPMNVQDGWDISRRSPVTIADALQSLPGIALIRDGNWETAVAIRGLGPSNVVALVDDARMEASTDIAGVLSLVNIHDVERVEAILSPGSALHGTGALGGVVQFVTRKPTFDSRSQWRAELSEDAATNGNRLAHHAALEHSSDRLSFRVSAGYRHSADIHTATAQLPNSRFTDMSLTTAILTRPVDNHNVEFSYQRVQAEDTGIPGGAPIAASATARYTLARRELFQAHYSVLDLSDVLRRVSLRASHQSISRNVEIIQSPTLIVTPHAAHNTLSAKAEALLLPANDHVLTCGIDTWERTLESRRERRNLVSGQVTGERPVPASSFLSLGAYVQDEIHLLTDRGTLIVSGRYDGIRVRNDETWNPEYVQISGISISPVPNQQRIWLAQEVWNRSWSVNAGFRYALEAGTDATLSFSSAFRAPSLEERYQFIDLGNLVRLGDPSLHPEQSRAWNLGVRSRTDIGTVRINVYLHDLTDLVADVPGVYNGRAAFFKQNIGAARIHGFECEAEHAVLPWLFVGASGSIVRGEDVRMHANLPQIPPMTGRVEVTATSSRIGSCAVILTSAAAQDRIAGNEKRTAGYSVVDISASSIMWDLGVGRITIRANIQNVFNRSYRNHLSTLRGSITEEMGRNFSAGMTIFY